MNPATFTASTFELRDSGGRLVPGDRLLQRRHRRGDARSDGRARVGRRLHGAGSRAAPPESRISPETRSRATTRGRSLTDATAAADARARLDDKQVLLLSGRDPAGGGAERVRLARRRAALTVAPRRVRRGRSGRRRRSAPAQVTMLTDFVNAGGNLIALQPGQAARRAPRPHRRRHDARERLPARRHGSSAPGAGIAGQTMQFHGTADRYSAERGDRRRDALLGPLHDDLEPGGDPPQRRPERRPGGSVHVRPRPLDRPDPPGKPGMGRARTATGIAPARPNDLFFGAAAGDAQPDWLDTQRIGDPAGGRAAAPAREPDRGDEPRPQAAAALLVSAARREGGRRDDRRRPRRRRHGRAASTQYMAAEPARLLGRATGSACAGPRTSIRTTRLTNAPGGGATRRRASRSRIHVTTELRGLDAAQILDSKATTQLADFADELHDVPTRRQRTEPTASPGATGPASRRSNAPTASGSTRTTTTIPSAGSARCRAT